MIKRD